jgi:hypothetical protein
MTTTPTKEMRVSEHEQPAMPPSAPEPHPKLRDLDVLEGEWRLEGRDSSGEQFTGTVRRRWLPGRFFLEQQMRIDGQQHDGTEYIGYDFAAESLRSMFFSNEGPGPFCSFALEYFWEITGDQLTIWHGYKNSPAKFTGTIDRDAGVVHGHWEWPGGGYEATATRVPADE